MESSGFNNSNASKSQFRSVKDLNFSDGCSNTGVEPLLSKDAVYDRTLRNKRDIIWTIRDPSTRKVMARLKNPVVPISPLNPRVKKFLDLDDNVNNGDPPNFGLLFQNLEFDGCKQGWELMGDLMKSKKHHKSFWEFVEKLKNLRKLFNRIVENKMKTLPGRIRRRPSVEALFA
jgi:hypothetical protein